MDLSISELKGLTYKQLREGLDEGPIRVTHHGHVVARIVGPNESAPPRDVYAPDPGFYEDPPGYTDKLPAGVQRGVAGLKGRDRGQG